MKYSKLEDRTLEFSRDLIKLCRELPFNMVNKELVDQCIRSGTSIGANYREANETDTKKDFRNRIRIAKKEAKETIYWLNLLEDVNRDFFNKITKLKDECTQLMKILASIYMKTS